MSQFGNGLLDVGHGISAPNSAWTFAGQVAETFDQHVRQSIPLYDQGHDLICQISDYFVKDHAIVYEIGCSVGELSLKLATHHTCRQFIQIHAIDCELDMVQKAAQARPHPVVSYHHADACTLSYEPADLIVAYYTIQFIPPKQRQQLIDTLYQSLNWGGALIMFEKVRAPDARFQDIMGTLYTDLKLQNGFAASEIINKTRSLKGVLEPFSSQGNLDMLKRAGFQDMMTVMKYVCFEGFLAIK